MPKPCVSRLICCLVMMLLLSGCAARTIEPVVWTNPQASIKDYQVFQLWPVFNATGGPVDATVLSSLSAYLEDEFKALGLELQPGQAVQEELDYQADQVVPEEVSGLLAVNSDLVLYQPQERQSFYRSWPVGAVPVEIRCTLRTRLVDKAAKRPVAEISVTRSKTYTTVSAGRSDARQLILQETAAALANEVARLLGKEVR